MPDFIALRGDPSDKIPGARGVGAKTAARCSSSTPTLEAMLAAGPLRGPGGGPAPVPADRHARPLRAAARPARREPDWEAARAGRGGARARARLAGAARARLAIELVSHPALAHLHPTGPSIPRREERLRRCSSVRAGVEAGRAAPGGDRARPRPGATSTRIESLDERAGSTATRSAQPTTCEAALLAAGCAIEAVERGGFALVRPPGHHALADRRDGLLPLQQRRDRSALRAGRARARARRDPRLGRPPRQRHGGHRPGRRLVLFVSLHQWPFYPGTGGPGTSDGDDRQRPARRPAPATTSTSTRSTSIVEPAVRRSSPTCCSSPPASTPTRTTRSPRCG